MNKSIIVGIVVLGIIGVLVVISINSFSILEDGNSTSEPILGKEGEEKKEEPKPLGRDLTVELEEKMGLSTP